jgi:hypothetical protein
VPLFILMWSVGLFPMHSIGAIITLLILDFDLALGLAVLRTMKTYRQRVELVYSMMNPDEGEEEPQVRVAAGPEQKTGEGTVVDFSLGASEGEKASGGEDEVIEEEIFPEEEPP